MLNDWQDRRSKFNHDWLKNGFLANLNTFLVRLERENPIQEDLEIFIREELPEWESRIDEAEWLCKTVEDEMSPRRFFDVPPLANCSEETKQWLPELMHTLWMERYPIQKLRKDGSAALSRANTEYSGLKTALQETGMLSLERLRSLKGRFVALRSAASELRDILSAFDQDVRRI
jgi:hypothetical protein